MAGFGSAGCFSGTKVLHKRLYRLGRVSCLAVVVTGNGKDGRRVVLVWVVKLIMVAKVVTCVIDEVAQVIKKAWLIGQTGIMDLPGHVIGNVLLCPQAVDSACVPDSVKADLACLSNHPGSLRQNRS
jgi:hypothetical protein